METLLGNQTLPYGVLLSDLSDRELREDDDFFEALWDSAHRFAEENERD